MGFILEAATIFFILYMDHDIIYATKKTIIPILDIYKKYKIIYCDFVMQYVWKRCLFLPSRVACVYKRNLIKSPRNK